MTNQMMKYSEWNSSWWQTLIRMRRIKTARHSQNVHSQLFPKTPLNNKCNILTTRKQTDYHGQRVWLQTRLKEQNTKKFMLLKESVRLNQRLTFFLWLLLTDRKRNKNGSWFSSQVQRFLWQVKPTRLPPRSSAGLKIRFIP